MGHCRTYGPSLTETSLFSPYLYFPSQKQITGHARFRLPPLRSWELRCDGLLRSG